MRNLMLFVCFVLASSVSVTLLAHDVAGQYASLEPIPNAMADESAVFPGGNELIKSWLQMQIHYPEVAIDNGHEGRVVVAFIVDEQGKLAQFNVLKSMGKVCDNAVIAALEQMPNWQPARQNGTSVPVSMTVHVDFLLE